MTLIPDEIKEKMIKKIYNKILSFSFIYRFFIILIFSLLFFVFIRTGYFGSGIQQISYNIFKSDIPYIDKNNDLSITSLFEYLNNDVFKPIYNDSSHKSDEVMRIKYTTNKKCWILIISIDSKGFHKIVGNNDSVIYNPRKDSFDVINFKLDKNKGLENYFIFASEKSFKFSNDIKPYLKNNLSKGYIIFNKLNIPLRIKYNGVVFNHI